jgi:hypothetical protein
MQITRLQREISVSSFSGGIGVIIHFIPIQRLTYISVPSSKVFPPAVTKGSGTVFHTVMKSSLKRLQDAYASERSEDCLESLD